MLKGKYDHRIKLYIEHNDHYAISTDHEITPEKIWDDLYKYLDFLKLSTADPFPPDELWTREFHHCGFTRHLSPQDIFINSPWNKEQAALSILKALKLFDTGANVGLLLQRRSF